jgi:hypothetical protein
MRRTVKLRRILVAMIEQEQVSLTFWSSITLILGYWLFKDPMLRFFTYVSCFLFVCAVLSVVLKEYRED